MGYPVLRYVGDLPFNLAILAPFRVPLRRLDRQQTPRTIRYGSLGEGGGSRGSAAPPHNNQNLWHRKRGF